MKTLIRKTFPKIRLVNIKGFRYYQVDCRKQGTDGKRETFKSKAEAESKANEVALDFTTAGTDGVVFDADLRNEAKKAKAVLSPYEGMFADAPATITAAVKHYLLHLQNLVKKQESGLLAALLDKWLTAKRTDKNDPLRKATLDSYTAHVSALKKAFAGLKLSELTETSFQAYLDNGGFAQSTKQSLLVKTGTFLNWCVAEGLLDKNPLSEIKIIVGNHDVEIVKPAEAQGLLNICVKSYPEYTLYHAIGLFAGLRPTECALLNWKDIYYDDNTKKYTIQVLSHTSKRKETRNVAVEDNLAAWLNSYTGKRVGLVTPQVGLEQTLTKIRKAYGWNVAKFDVLRHSYASYWLAKYNDRPRLAEYMGNSIKVIGKHYKAVVTDSAFENYWSIKPDGADTTTGISKAALVAARAKGIAKGLSGH